MTLARTVVCASACLLLASLQASAALGQAPPTPDQWAAVRFLLGTWEGVSEGQAGNGTVRRE